MSAGNQAWKDVIITHLQESADVKRLASQECAADIEQAATLFVDALRNGGKLLFCGNGGSAADCQHIAAEFVSVLRQDFKRPALAAIALTTDTSFLTANANDFGFEGVFSRQVEALGRPGDVLIGISTSGNSANVVQALLVARHKDMITIAFTGKDGGNLKDLADVNIKVPSSKVQYVQESHIAIGHILCALTEEALFQDLDTSL